MIGRFGSLIRHGALAAIAALSFGAPTVAQAADFAITDIDYLDVEARRVVRGGLIVVRDGRIAYAGEDADQLPSDVEVIDGTRLVALPGFVNAHTHLWQHVAKGLKPAGDLQA